MSISSAMRGVMTWVLAFAVLAAAAVGLSGAAHAQDTCTGANCCLSLNRCYVSTTGTDGADRAGRAHRAEILGATADEVPLDVLRVERVAHAGQIERDREAFGRGVSGRCACRPG